MRVPTFRVKFRVLLAALSVCAFSQAGESRRFDFKEASFGTYFKGTYGTSSLGQSAFGESSGASTTSFSENIKTGYTGEFGILFSATKFNVRLGAELLYPASASETKGKNASGTELFNVASSVYAITPMASIEYIVTQSPSAKFYVGGSGGYAFVKLENEYKFTDDSPYGLSDFKEGASGTTTMLAGYVGYELMLADNATVQFEGGYRRQVIDALEYDAAVTHFQGAKAAGDILTKDNGSHRQLDMSGGYIGLGFRFYLGL